MDKTAQCIQSMEFSDKWEKWKKTFKESIQSSRTYYQDETVVNLVSKLNIFLEKRVCSSSAGEEIVKTLWDVASPEERRTLATLFFRIVDQF